MSLGKNDDDAPETVSLTDARAEALGAMRAARTAASAQSSVTRERRRVQDARLKERAEERKERVAAVLAELKSPRNGGRHAKQTTTTPIKTIFRGNSDEEERDETVQVTSGTEVVVLKEKRVVRMNVQKARELSKSREEMQLLRNARKRVHISTRLAARRVGMPAAQFALKPKERPLVAAKYVQTRSTRQPVDKQPIE